MSKVIYQIGLVLVILCVSFTTSSAQKIKTFEKTYSMDKNGSVSIDTYKGSVEVETWDKAEVYVYAEMEADNNWDCTEPDEQLDNVEIYVSNSSSYIRIKSDYEETNSWGCNTLALVHYKIKMPKAAELEIDDHKSEINIDGITGYLDVNCYKGKMEFKNIAGQIDLDTYKGDAKVYVNKLTRDSKFDTYKGDIDIYMPSGSAFSVDVDIEKKGDFDCDFDIDTRGSYKKYRDYDFKGDVNGGGPYIELSSYKGNIRILKK